MSPSRVTEILTKPKNAMVKQYAKLMSMDDVVLNVTKDALHAMAEEAVETVEDAGDEAEAAVDGEMTGEADAAEGEGDAAEGVDEDGNPIDR